MKTSVAIVSCCIILVFFNLIAFATHDYLWDLENAKCTKIKQLNYDVPTSDMTTCINYEVNQFYHFTLNHYSLLNLLAILFCVVIIFTWAVLDDYKPLYYHEYW